MGAGGFFARTAFFAGSAAAPSSLGASASAAGFGASAAFFFVDGFLGAGMAETCFSVVPIVEPGRLPYFLWFSAFIERLY
jgi:hypothetical protein